MRFMRKHLNKIFTLVALEISAALLGGMAGIRVVSREWCMVFSEKVKIKMQNNMS